MTCGAVFVAPMQSERTFRRVIELLRRDGAEFEAESKDMAVMTRPDRHADWTLDAEVADLEHTRVLRGLAQMDLVGYSGGGAACLAYAAAHPELVRSLALIEPPWIGNDVWSDEEAAWGASYDAIADAPDELVWDAVFALLNGDGARPVPPVMEGAPLRDAFMFVRRGYCNAVLDRTRLERLDAPVYLPVGGASAPRMRLQAERLASHLPRAEVEVIDGFGHFDLVVGAAERIAAGLARAWGEAR